MAFCDFAHDSLRIVRHVVAGCLQCVTRATGTTDHELLVEYESINAERPSSKTRYVFIACAVCGQSFLVACDVATVECGEPFAQTRISRGVGTMFAPEVVNKEPGKVLLRLFSPLHVRVAQWFLISQFGRRELKSRLDYG